MSRSTIDLARLKKKHVNDLVPGDVIMASTTSTKPGSGALGPVSMSSITLIVSVELLNEERQYELATSSERQFLVLCDGKLQSTRWLYNERGSSWEECDIIVGYAVSEEPLPEPPPKKKRNLRRGP